MPADRLDIMYVEPPQTEGGKSIWYKLGVAFLSRDGSGYSAVLGTWPIAPKAPLRLQLLDSNRGRGGAPQQQRTEWQQRPPPGPARRPMPIDRGAPPPPPPPEEEEDDWPGPR